MANKVSGLAGRAVALLVLAALVAEQAHCGGLYCSVKYMYSDEKCAECCRRSQLMAVSAPDGACQCIESVAEQFEQKYPRAVEEFRRLSRLSALEAMS